MIKKEHKISIMLAILTLTVISAIYYIYFSRNLKNETIYIKQYISNAKKLIKLKNWRDGKNFKKTIEKITSLKKPNVYQNEKNIVKLQFSNLEKKPFLQIGDTVLNSYVVIKRLKIDKNSKNRVELMIELQR